MIVTDAGVWVRAIVGEQPGGPTRARLVAAGAVAAPALIDLEFTNVVRGLVIKRTTSAADGELALIDYLRAPIQRHLHEPLVPRIWQLRSNLTAYDAAYVALAEALGVDLVTLDHRLAQAPGIRCRVEVL